MVKHRNPVAIWQREGGVREADAANEGGNFAAQVNCNAS